MNLTAALERIVQRSDLSADEMRAAMTEIMSGRANNSQIAGFLVAMRMKEETVEELSGAASAMRQLATSVTIKSERAVDTCGTGGDGASIFNVSTAAAFVAAACGATVAKHGNRSVSSSTGSADLLETAGAKLELSAEQVARAIDAVGVGFMFAVNHHPAMKHAIIARRELKLRSFFNMLGPMTNPAGVKRQVVGVYDQALCMTMARVLQQLGSEHVIVVHSHDGLDEFSIAAPSSFVELKNGELSEHSVSPEQFGLSAGQLSDLKVASAEESLTVVSGIYNNDKRYSQHSDMVAFNAGAAIYVAGEAHSFAEGVSMASDAIASGLAGEKFKEFIEFTQCV